MLTNGLRRFQGLAYRATMSRLFRAVEETVMAPKPRKKKAGSKRGTRRREKTRVALVGAGGMANLMHYPSLAAMPDVSLVAICDLVRVKAQDTAKQFKIPKVFTDYRRMLDQVEADAVYVLMPPHQLFDVAVEVMGRGRHLFIEKPPGLNAFQNRQLSLHAERNGVIAMCGFQRRYVPHMNALRDAVAERGPLHTVIVTFVKCSFPDGGYYNGAVDILSCDAVHAVDTLRHFCGGRVVSVASDVRTLGADAPNAFYAIVRFSNGATGILQTNWACGRRFFRVEFHAQGVSGYVDPDESGVLYRDGNTDGETFAADQYAPKKTDWGRLGFYSENRHFIDCVRSGEMPCSNLADTVATMELVDRIYHSEF